MSVVASEQQSPARNAAPVASSVGVPAGDGLRETGVLVKHDPLETARREPSAAGGLLRRAQASAAVRSTARAESNSVVTKKSADNATVRTDGIAAPDKQHRTAAAAPSPVRLGAPVQSDGDSASARKKQRAPTSAALESADTAVPHTDGVSVDAQAAVDDAVLPAQDAVSAVARRVYEQTVRALAAEPFFADTEADTAFPAGLAVDSADVQRTKLTDAQVETAKRDYAQTFEALSQEDFFEGSATSSTEALAATVETLINAGCATDVAETDELSSSHEVPAESHHAPVLDADSARKAVSASSDAVALPSALDAGSVSRDAVLSSVAETAFLERGGETDGAAPLSAAMKRRALRAERAALRQERKAAKRRLAQEQEEIRKQQREEARATRIRRPIGVKLIAIISVVVVLALSTVTLLVSYFITEDVRTSAEENNLAINSRTAADCESRISNAVASVGMFLDLLDAAGGNETEVQSVETMFFERHPQIAAVFLPRGERLFTNGAFLISRELDRDAVAAYFAQEQDTFSLAENGAVEILNASMFFNVPLLAFIYPVPSVVGAVAVLYSSEEMSESFASGNINQSFFVNDEGIVLVHSDIAEMMAGTDESDSPIVAAMRGSQQGNSQITYREGDEEYIGAFRKLSLGNGGIITVVRTSIVLEGIRATTRRNFYIMFAILFLAVMMVYFFSKSLSQPLRQLTSVVNEINKGNFNTELFNDLNINAKDEIGMLAKSTKNEREILNMFSRLTNKGVTKAVITKQIDFEPHLKDITIFFSDIRGFTAISDGFKARFGERSAAEIIGFLNDYMSRMVACIRRTGGIVDKFEGDAIMACWGVLRSDALDWEKGERLSVTELLERDAHERAVRADALSAIKSCIAMRYSLMQYNKDAAAFTEAHKNDELAQYKPQIRIGAGLNSGRVTVGFMGSYDKMEFTSIGDAVNLASRTEASNKPCGTDILITEDTRALLKDYIRSEENDFTLAEEYAMDEIIIEQIPVEFEVKGKGKQHFYGVVNMPRFDITGFFSELESEFVLDEDCARAVGSGGPRTLKELRALLGIPEPNFGQVNLDAEENKIQVAEA